MTEARIAFLYKAASMLSAANMNKTQEKLKSYYRMRCKEVSKGYGLPQKHFSEQVICTYCCLEWRKDTEIKMEHIKLTKRQRKRIKSLSKMSKHAGKIHLLNSKEIQQTCKFCGHTTKTVASKPKKSVAIKQEQPLLMSKGIPKETIQKVQTKNNLACDIYSNTAQVFSLNNKNNTLKSTIKEPKIIKNNKKKKDKFAGLCKKAVLMSAQLKQEKERQNVIQEKEKQNKLSLFLKPSS